MGNIEQWAQIEILTFYSQILIMIVYLLITSLISNKSKLDNLEDKKDQLEEAKEPLNQPEDINKS